MASKHEEKARAIRSVLNDKRYGGEFFAALRQKPGMAKSSRVVKSMKVALRKYDKMDGQGGPGFVPTPMTAQQAIDSVTPAKPLAPQSASLPANSQQQSKASAQPEFVGPLVQAPTLNVEPSGPAYASTEQSGGTSPGAGLSALGASGYEIGFDYRKMLDSLMTPTTGPYVPTTASFGKEEIDASAGNRGVSVTGERNPLPRNPLGPRTVADGAIAQFVRPEVSPVQKAPAADRLDPSYPLMYSREGGEQMSREVAPPQERLYTPAGAQPSRWTNSKMMSSDFQGTSSAGQTPSPADKTPEQAKSDLQFGIDLTKTGETAKGVDLIINTPSAAHLDYLYQISGATKDASGNWVKGTGRPDVNAMIDYYKGLVEADKVTGGNSADKVWPVIEAASKGQSVETITAMMTNADKLKVLGFPADAMDAANLNFLGNPDYDKIDSLARSAAHLNAVEDELRTLGAASYHSQRNYDNFINSKDTQVKKLDKMIKDLDEKFYGTWNGNPQSKAYYDNQRAMLSTMKGQTQQRYADWVADGVASSKADYDAAKDGYERAKYRYEALRPMIQQEAVESSASIKEKIKGAITDAYGAAVGASSSMTSYYRAQSEYATAMKTMLAERNATAEEEYKSAMWKDGKNDVNTMTEADKRAWRLNGGKMPTSSTANQATAFDAADFTSSLLRKNTGSTDKPSWEYYTPSIDSVYNWVTTKKTTDYESAGKLWGVSVSDSMKSPDGSVADPFSGFDKINEKFGPVSADPVKSAIRAAAIKSFSEQATATAVSEANKVVDAIGKSVRILKKAKSSDDLVKQGIPYWIAEILWTNKAEITSDIHDGEMLKKGGDFSLKSTDKELGQYAISVIQTLTNSNLESISK
jgi:hypothetical protein